MVVRQSRETQAALSEVELLAGEPKNGELAIIDIESQ
jgi:hypothetical protein